MLCVILNKRKRTTPNAKLCVLFALWRTQDFSKLILVLCITLLIALCKRLKHWKLSKRMPFLLTLMCKYDLKKLLHNQKYYGISKQHHCACVYTLGAIRESFFCTSTIVWQWRLIAKKEKRCSFFPKTTVLYPTPNIAKGTSLSPRLRRAQSLGTHHSRTCTLSEAEHCISLCMANQLSWLSVMTMEQRERILQRVAV